MEDILDVIKDMQEDTAPGPDGVTAFLFKSYAAELAPRSTTFREYPWTKEGCERELVLA